MAEIRGLGDLLERALRHQCRDRGDEEGPDPIRHRPFGIAGREQHDDKGKRVGKVAPLIVAADGGHADDRRDIREPFRLAPQETDTLRGTRRDQDTDAAEDGETEVKEERDERLVTPELEVVPKIGWLQDPESRQPRHEIAKPERGDDGRRVDGERAQRLARQPRLAMDAEDGNHQSELAADRGEHREHPREHGLARHRDRIHRGHDHRVGAEVDERRVVRKELRGRDAERQVDREKQLRREAGTIRRGEQQDRDAEPCHVEHVHRRECIDGTRNRSVR